MPYLVLANVAIAFLLVVSGAAKLRAPAATRDAFTALRLPDFLRRSPAPAVLPWAELALAVILLTGSSWLLTLGAVGALLLFVAYTVIIARALRFGEPVRCACFGTLGAHDVSRRTLIRNILLMLLAGLGLWAAVEGLNIYSLGWDGWGWILVAAVVTAAVTLSLGGASAQGVASVDGLGWLARASVTEPETGRPVALNRLAAEHGGVVLLFVLAGCGACERVLAQLPAWREAQPDRVVVPVTLPGDRPGNLTGPGVYEDPGFNLATALSGGATPTAIELGRDGVPVGPPAVGTARVIELITGSAESAVVPDDSTPAAPAQEAAPPIGEAADDLADYERRPIPDGVLLDHEREPVTVRQLAERRAQLLVGIDCLCSPARHSIDNLLAWQERLPILDVRLVVPFKLRPDILTGGREAMALYDHRGLASRSLGLLGQTSAVLLGADGLLAGGPVSGREAVEEFVAEIEAQVAGADLPPVD